MIIVIPNYLTIFINVATTFHFIKNKIPTKQKHTNITSTTSDTHKDNRATLTDIECIFYIVIIAIFSVFISGAHSAELGWSVLYLYSCLLIEITLNKDVMDLRTRPIHPLIPGVHTDRLFRLQHTLEQSYIPFQSLHPMHLLPLTGIVSFISSFWLMMLLERVFQTAFLWTLFHTLFTLVISLYSSTCFPPELYRIRFLLTSVFRFFSLNHGKILSSCLVLMQGTTHVHYSYTLISIVLFLILSACLGVLLLCSMCLSCVAVPGLFPVTLR